MAKLNIEAEMLREEITFKDIADLLKCSERTARNKIRGATTLSFPDAQEIKCAFFPKLDYDYLFSSSKDTA